MQTISGIGGIFFRAKDPTAMAAWYEQNFGIIGPTGGDVWRPEAGPTVFAPFKADSDYYPREQSFMLNFRVKDMAAMLEQLKR